MKKSAEAQLAAKAADDKEQRIRLTLVAREFPEKAEEMLRRADEARAGFLKWRAGVLRFRSGVEDRLAEASWRRRVSTSMIPRNLLDERRQLLQQVEVLRGAIEAHRQSMADLEPDDIDEADETLWAVLSTPVSHPRSSPRPGGQHSVRVDPPEPERRSIRGGLDR